MKEYFEGERDVVDLPAGSDVRFLLQMLRDGEPGPPGLWESIAVAVNREYAASSATLKDGDEVALLPPVSGGAVAAMRGIGAH